MSDIRNGGPAFPGQWYDFQPCTGDQVVREQWEGMTLRDYFAAKAMAAMVASPDYAEGEWFQGDIAHQAYQMADAMLKQREE